MLSSIFIQYRSRIASSAASSTASLAKALFKTSTLSSILALFSCRIGSSSSSLSTSSTASRTSITSINSSFSESFADSSSTSMPRNDNKYCARFKGSCIALYASLMRILVASACLFKFAGARSGCAFACNCRYSFRNCLRSGVKGDFGGGPSGKVAGKKS